MGRFGGGDDTPRVVGFDFGGPPAAPPPPPPPVLPPPPPMPPVIPPPLPPQDYGYAVAPVATYQPVGYGVPQPRPMPAPPAPPAARFRREVTVVVVLLALIGVVGGVQRLRSAGSGDDAPVAAQAPSVKVSLPPMLEDLNAPSTIGGAPRLATRQSRGLAMGLRQLLPNNGRHSEIEIYGRETPQYAILAGGITPGNSRRMYDWFTAKTKRVRYHSPGTYAGGMVCSRYSISSTNGSVCAWGTKTSDGIVVGYNEQNPAALAKVAVRARRDLERGY